MTFPTVMVLVVAVGCVLRALWASTILQRHVGWIPGLPALGVEACFLGVDSPAVGWDVLFNILIAAWFTGEFVYQCVAKPAEKVLPGWQQKFAPGNYWIEGLTLRRDRN